MKSKNTLVIAGTIGFIIAYQFLVLGPYNDQKREFEKAQQAEVAKQNPVPTPSTRSNSGGVNLNGTPDSSTDSSSNAAENTAQKTSSNNSALPLQNPQLVTNFNVGGTRSLEVFEGGTFGSAVLENYFEREAPKGEDKKVISLNKNGLYWYASNPAVQKCINTFNSSTLNKGNPDQISFASNTPEGTCELSLSPDGSHDGLLKVKLSVDGFASGPNDVIELRGQFVLGSENQLDQKFASYKLEDSVENVRGNDIFETNSIKGKLGWMTWGDRYFSLIFQPQGSYNPDFIYGVSQNPGDMDPLTAKSPFALRYPLQPERGKSRFEYEMIFYFGARSTTVLNDIDPELVETVELGFFASVARIMLWALEALYDIFKNYGVAIIVLTLIVRAIFWPLNKKAYKSQAMMKDIQPEMDAIRKKYDQKDRDQAAQMNKEIFALYKTKGVNPLGGCLPLVLQMPILIGLYGGLNNSIELYQAPFAGWIQDLSLPDAYFVLPIVWTISLLGYMKINPQTMNTSQPGMPNMKWMFIGMNLFFGFLSKDWPSGLVLYLVVSNTVGLTQQYFIQSAKKKKIEIV